MWLRVELLTGGDGDNVIGPSLVSSIVRGRQHNVHTPWGGVFVKGSGKPEAFPALGTPLIRSPQLSRGEPERGCPRRASSSSSAASPAQRGRRRASMLVPVPTAGIIAPRTPWHAREVVTIPGACGSASWGQGLSGGRDGHRRGIRYGQPGLMATSTAAPTDGGAPTSSQPGLPHTAEAC
jgi:hypothetical protein